MTNRQPESRAVPFGYGLPPFHVSVRSDGANSLVVDVEGELDLATGPILQQRLESYQQMPERQSPLQTIVFDLSDLRFMDATGLEALLTAIEGHGPRSITVRQPSPQVRRILELVGLNWMIEDEKRRTNQ